MFCNKFKIYKSDFLYFKQVDLHLKLFNIYIYKPLSS